MRGWTGSHYSGVGGGLPFDGAGRFLYLLHRVSPGIFSVTLFSAKKKLSKRSDLRRCNTYDSYDTGVRTKQKVIGQVRVCL